MGILPGILRNNVLLVWLLLGVSSPIVRAQVVPRTTLTGRVTNATDGLPLPFASVYLNGTTRGTTTSEDGQFKLVDVPYGASELVVSYTGFLAVKQPIRVTDSEPGTLVIALSPMANLLSGVVVTAKRDKTWLRQVEQFERDMIGASAFARQCTIVNPEVLEFTESGSVLTATAREALLIDNQALGYRLTYTLISFRSQLKTGKIVFGGTTLFNELTPESPNQTRLWQRNRQQAYQGSVRQLLAGLAAGTHEKDGFLVYLTDPARPLRSEGPILLKNELGRHLKPFDVNALIRPGTLAHERWLISNSPLEIFYTRVPSPESPYRDAQFAFSELVLPQQSLGFNVTGQITAPRGFEAVGFLSNDRLATALPDDWQHDATSATQMAAARLDSASLQADKRMKADVALDSLVRRWQRQPGGASQIVFLHIDKPLYLTGDRLWLSGYVLNPQTQQCDTATVGQALNVELWSEKNVLILHQWLRVEAGRATGTFQLADSLTTGTYWLRAYTETDRQRGKPAFERPVWVANSQIKLAEQELASYEPDVKVVLGAASEFVEEVIGAPYRTTVSVNSDQFTIKLDARSKARLPTAYALVEVRGRLVKAAYISVQNTLTTTSWPTRTWPSGLALLSLMDSTGRVWTRRTVRIAEQVSAVTARISRVKGNTGQPEQETLRLALRTEAGAPISAKVSVVVTDADLTPADSLVNDLPAHLLSVDNRRGTYLATKPSPGITLHGQVSTTEKHPVNVVLTITDRQGVLTRSAQTDESGHFQVSQLALADTAQVIVQVTNRRGKPIRATVSFSQQAGQSGSFPYWPDATPLFAQWRSLIKAARQRQLAEPALYRPTAARQLRELVVPADQSVNEQKGLSRHLLPGYASTPAFPVVDPTMRAKPIVRDVLAWEPLATTDKLGEVSVPLVVPRSVRRLRVTLQGVSSSGQAISWVQLLPAEPPK